MRDNNAVCNRLRSRSYSEWTLKRAINKVANIPQSDLLKEENILPSGETKRAPIAFSTPYSAQFKQITKIIKRHLPLLATDDKMQEVLDNGVPIISRLAPTIANLISPSLFSRNPSTDWLSKKGFFRCGYKQCTA